MTIKYYELFRFEDFNYDNKVIDMRMRISNLLNKNIFPKKHGLRKRIKKMSKDLSPIQKRIFIMLATYVWKKSRNVNSINYIIL